ncbi:hypothetical protein ACMUMS_17455, partial [Acinetobacter courvalinii]
YRLRKSGWHSGDSHEHTPYYYYHFYIKGNLKDGVIELKIYENQEKYEIKYIQKNLGLDISLTLIIYSEYHY